MYYRLVLTQLSKSPYSIIQIYQNWVCVVHRHWLTTLCPGCIWTEETGQPSQAKCYIILSYQNFQIWMVNRLQFENLSWPTLSNICFKPTNKIFFLDMLLILLREFKFLRYEASKWIKTYWIPARTWNVLLRCSEKETCAICLHFVGDNY